MNSIVNKNFISKGQKPANGQYVLGRVIGRPWLDKDDPIGNRFWVVVKFHEGITMAERAALHNDNERKRIFRSEDEGGNNMAGFYWKPFGAGSFFGQEIDEWVSLDGLSIEA
ncbi:hypothetical protein RFA54_001617 [Vibrio vulnificus]|nr:hypothetical protein [Vibrio vulnificus]